jgi:hypothetical protein
MTSQELELFASIHESLVRVEDAQINLNVDIQQGFAQLGERVGILNIAAGTNANLLEQYRSDLENSARGTTEQLKIIRERVQHISDNGCSRACPPTDPCPPADEQTDPAIPSLHPVGLRAVGGG